MKFDLDTCKNNDVLRMSNSNVVARFIKKLDESDPLFSKEKPYLICFQNGRTGTRTRDGFFRSDVERRSNKDKNVIEIIKVKKK